MRERERETRRAFVVYICCFCAVAPLCSSKVFSFEMPTFHQFPGFGHSLISLALEATIHIYFLGGRGGRERCTGISDFTRKLKPHTSYMFHILCTSLVE